MNFEENKEQIIFGDFSQYEDEGTDTEDKIVELVKENDKLFLSNDKEDEEEEKEQEDNEEKVVEKKEVKKSTAKQKEVLIGGDVDEEEEDESDSDDENYYEQAKSLVSLGVWQDFQVEGEREDFLDKETFEALKETQKEKILEEIYGNVDEDEKEFLKIKKEGGDFKQYAQAVLFKQAVNELDITTENGKKTAIFSYYKNMIGWSDEKIMKHIKRAEEDMELDSEAEMAMEKISEKAEAQKQAIADAHEAKQAAIKKAEDEYKKDLEANFKKVKGFDSVKIKNALKDFTERDEKGFTNVDKKFLEYRNNPEEAEFLWNILMNREAYLKSAVNKKVTEENMKTMTKVIVGKKEENNAASGEPYKKQTKIIKLL